MVRTHERYHWKAIKDTDLSLNGVIKRIFLRGGGPVGLQKILIFSKEILPKVAQNCAKRKW